MRRVIDEPPTETPEEWIAKQKEIETPAEEGESESSESDDNSQYGPTAIKLKYKNLLKCKDL